MRSSAQSNANKLRLAVAANNERKKNTFFVLNY